MKRDKYNTNSKKMILKIIEDINESFTIKDLENYIKKEKINIGQTTIYRYISELEEKKIVKKFFNDDNIAHYQYLKHCDENNCFYLKCHKCGDIIHIDCDCINKLQKHILKLHNFTIDNKDVIISGICKNCLGGK